MTARMHVALDVADLDRSTDFYSRLFGLQPAKRFDDYVKFELDEPPLVLSLNPAVAAAEGPQRLSHLGVRVSEAAEFAALRERLAAAGFQPREEHGTACCYAYADKLWVSDPDGNEWELYQRLGDAPVRYPGDGECCAPASGATTQAASSCCAPR
jgi:catechol 2,3-dioxygenase-like lactoylglutathione lyase family enzyme